MKLLNDKARKLVLQMIRANLQLVEVESGLCRFNFRCADNAVHDAIQNDNEKIAMVFYIDGQFPIIHFINVSSGGELIDNTLGNWSSQYEYYLIRYINKNTFFNIHSVFINYRKELRKNLPFFVRLFSNEDF